MLPSSRMNRARRIGLIAAVALGGCRPDTTEVVAAPDLRIGGVTAPTIIVAGQKVSLVFVVENAGTASAPGGWLLRSYISQDRQITSADAAIGELVQHLTLAPNTASSLSLSVIAPLSFGDRVAYLGVIADQAHIVAEINRDNNVGVTETGSQVYVRPDLEVGPFTLRYPGIPGSPSFELTGNLYNQGNVPVSTFKLRVYFAPGGSLTSSSPVIATVTFPEEWSGANWTSMAKRTFSVPAEYTGVAGRVFVKVDPDDETAEMSETNNLRGAGQ